MSLPPAEWYPDPVQPGLQRYWDGTAWSASTRPVAVPPPPPPAQPQAQFQPQPQAQFQPQPQAQFQPQPQAQFQPQPQAQFQPQPQAQFQPQPQAQFQPQPQAQAQVQFQPQTQTQPSAANTAWSTAAAWSPETAFSPRQGAGPASMPSRDPFASDFSPTHPGFNPGASLPTYTTPLRQRTRVSGRVGASLATGVVILLVRVLVPAVIDALNGPDRTLTASDVRAPAGWEVQTSPSGAVAYAFDPQWVDAVDDGSIPSYQELEDAEGTQFKETSDYWALVGSPEQPRTALVVAAISTRNGGFDARRTAENWVEQSATELGDGNPTVLTSEELASGRGYDGWHTKYSVNTSGGTLYFEDFIVVDFDSALQVSCVSTQPTSTWHNALLALTNSAVIVGPVRAPSAT